MNLSDLRVLSLFLSISAGFYLLGSTVRGTSAIYDDGFLAAIMTVFLGGVFLTSLLAIFIIGYILDQRFKYKARYR